MGNGGGGGRGGGLGGPTASGRINMGPFALLVYVLYKTKLKG